jgi:hypothetical protein
MPFSVTLGAEVPKLAPMIVTWGGLKVAAALSITGFCAGAN